MKTARKPKGYWHRFANLKKELTAFIKSQSGEPGLMPPMRSIRQAGLNSLLYAIELHGGYTAVATKLGLRVQHTPRSHKLPLGKLRSEIRQVAEACGAKGYMPTEADLLQAGRRDLLNAVLHWGGTRQVAQRLKLKAKWARSHLPEAPRDEAWLKAELAAFAQAHDLAGPMPSSRQLLGADRRDLYNAIRGLGGFVKIANQLGWKHTRSPQANLKRTPLGRGSQRNWTKLRQDLEAFIQTQGFEAGLMPSTTALAMLGRSDLVRAIERHGGQAAVARQLKWHDPASHLGYKLPLSILRAEINKLAKILGAPGSMPTEAELLQAKRVDLLKAIHKWGGSGVVAQRLHLTPKRMKTRLPPAPRNEEWLRTELHAYAEAHGLQGQMPTARQLLGAGRIDLYNAIRGMGGFVTIAKLMGWKSARRYRPAMPEADK